MEEEAKVYLLIIILTNLEGGRRSQLGAYEFKPSHPRDSPRKGRVGLWEGAREKG